MNILYFYTTQYYNAPHQNKLKCFLKQAFDLFYKIPSSFLNAIKPLKIIKATHYLKASHTQKL